MKKGVVLLAAAILGSSLLIGKAQAAEKFAYVNLSTIFSDYAKTKDYDKSLSDKENAYSQDREKKVNEVKQFQDKMNLLSDKEKETKKADMESKVKSLQDFDKQKQMDLRKEQDEKMKEILKDIEDTVKKYAEKEGYTFVFNDRVLVYQNKAYDITNKIVDLLNKGYKK